MLKKLFATSLLGMLSCTSLVLGSDHPNLGNNPSWEDLAIETAPRHRLYRRCRPSLPKTHAADGVRLNYCNSPESSIYQQQYQFLRPFISTITTLAHDAVNQALYQLLLDECNAIVAQYNSTFGVTSGRLVVVDADGLVLVDTSKGSLNTYANAQDGANPATFASAINVNHNNRTSIVDAQQYFNGVGLETKFSNSVGADQTYLAIRLGPILHNDGTARISQNTNN